jgi:two-component system, chemotaxis family, sensor histidine kinase and response regulator WspE
MRPSDLQHVSLPDLFKREVEGQVEVLTASLLALERNDAVADQLEAGMRAAHSVKGAARVVGSTVSVRVAGAMEECFVAAQHGRIALRHSQIDKLLVAVDLLKRIAATPERDLGIWANQKSVEVDASVAALEGVVEGHEIQGAATAISTPPEESCSPHHVSEREASERVLRVTAESLNRLLGLAGESLVESRWVKPFSESLLRLKRLHHESEKSIRRLRDVIPPQVLETTRSDFAAVEGALLKCQQLLSERLNELDMFDRRSSNLSRRLYDGALACRMRPFRDGVQGFPRSVRDLARSLGKEARLEIVGETTQVDRDILQKLDAPLGHLIRNAVDHGLETPDERRAAGKPPEGMVRLEARHSSGMLQVIVSDDGRGVDLERVREAAVQRGLIQTDAARNLSESEVLEFLFLPGLTLKDSVTEISGRGVGLDVVHDMVKQVRGIVRVMSQPGHGARFQLQLPVTLSVVRTLLVEVRGEPYAFPLTSIVRAVKVTKDTIERTEGRQHFDLDGRPVGLVTAHQVLGFEPATLVGDELSVIVVNDAARPYGLIVDRFLGERELVVLPFDPQMAKVRNIAAGALMEDGSPVLIVDIDDVVRSVDKLCTEARPTDVRDGTSTQQAVKRKRVLVVDDSMTVRELERKLLANLGYDVEVTVDGMDGWNALRTGRFDLVVTDIDMPRMDGIELVSLINKDPSLKTVPVMIVSYKDRDEDRRRGLEAGAAHYLAKASFQDDRLVQAVVDLIGEATS